MNFKDLGQNHFWHVPQTCPDVRNIAVCPARFLGVDQALGTCAIGHAAHSHDPPPLLSSLPPRVEVRRAGGRRLYQGRNRGAIHTKDM